MLRQAAWLLWAALVTVSLSAQAQTQAQTPARPALQGKLPSTPGAGATFAGLGPLAGKVESGQSGAWRAQDDGGKLILANPNAAGAVRFYVADWQGDLAAGRSVSLRVDEKATGEQPGAGIVFHVSDADPRWIAFVETADRKLVVYARAATELKRLGTFDIPGGHRPDGDLLQLNQKPGLAQFLANGRIVTELAAAAGLDPTLASPVGIIAMGQGEFTFDGFAFGPTVVPAAQRPAGDDTLPPARTAGDDTLPSSAPGKPDAPQIHAPLRSFTSDTFGALFGIMAHEFGHFMIGELKIPATGPEEDVADEFAAMVFIDNFKDAFEASKALAIGNAKLWWYMAQEHGDNATPFYDEHAPDRARFAKFSCMLYGAAPAAFEDLMNSAEIPDRSKQRCKMDEPKRHTAWDTLLRPMRRRGVDPNLQGDLDPATPGHKISVVYEKPKNPALLPYAEELRNSGIFEMIADSITKLYVLPRDTQLVFRDCGVENCFYNPQDGSVTMCWEMISFVMDEFRKHGEGIPAPNPTDPTPRPNPPSMTLDQLMVGRWRSQSPTTGMVTITQLAPQGQYEAQIMGPNQPQPVDIRGRWSVQAGNGNMIQLTFQPQQWYPPQLCNAGYCQPINPTPSTVGLQIVDRNTMRSQDGMVTRMQ